MRNSHLATRFYGRAERQTAPTRIVGTAGPRQWLPVAARRKLPRGKGVEPTSRLSWQVKHRHEALFFFHLRDFMISRYAGPGAG